MINMANFENIDGFGADLRRYTLCLLPKIITITGY